jgi:hypothetical protein
MAKNDLGKERLESGDEADLKVTDRRLFTADGRLRDELEESDEDSEAEPEPQPAQVETIEPHQEISHETSAEAVAAPDFERMPAEDPEGIDFTVLVNAMAQPALIFLGEIEHPGTGKPEVNLEQARLQIDLLTILRNKCRGNLTNEEDGLLDRLLYQLQMLFVEKSGQQGAPE